MTRTPARPDAGKLGPPVIPPEISRTMWPMPSRPPEAVVVREARFDKDDGGSRCLIQPLPWYPDPLALPLPETVPPHVVRSRSGRNNLVLRESLSGVGLHRACAGRQSGLRIRDKIAADFKALSPGRGRHRSVVRARYCRARQIRGRTIHHRRRSARWPRRRRWGMVRPRLWRARQ